MTFRARIQCAVNIENLSQGHCLSQVPDTYFQTATKKIPDLGTDQPLILSGLRWGSASLPTSQGLLPAGIRPVFPAGNPIITAVPAPSPSLL